MTVREWGGGWVIGGVLGDDADEIGVHCIAPPSPMSLEDVMQLLAFR